MADPIPRNSRADETAEYRRAEQERRANRPLFGQNMGGGLRARIENAQAQPQARPAPPQQQEPRNFGEAMRAAQERRQAQPPPPPAARANPLPQAEPRGVFDVLRRAVRQPQAVRAPIPRPAAVHLPPVLANRLRLLVGVGGALAVLAFGGALAGLGRGVIADETEGNPPAADELTIDAPLIPVSVPATECSVALTDLNLYRDARTNAFGRAMVAELNITASGCSGRFIRSAVWVFQAENIPLMAPDADPVYRSPIGQLTAQTLHRVQEAELKLDQTLAIPHSQFPTGVGMPQWLTVAVQVWREGEPAESGTLLTRQVYFTRAE